MPRLIDHWRIAHFPLGGNGLPEVASQGDGEVAVPAVQLQEVSRGAALGHTMRPLQHLAADFAIWLGKGALYLQRLCRLMCSANSPGPH